jgi:hypothetical protein
MPLPRALAVHPKRYGKEPCLRVCMFKRPIERIIEEQVERERQQRQAMLMLQIEAQYERYGGPVVVEDVPTELPVMCHIPCMLERPTGDLPWTDILTWTFWSLLNRLFDTIIG